MESSIASIGKIVTFLMALFSIFLLTLRTNRRLPARLFGIYLLVIAIDLTGFFTTLLLEHPLSKSLKLSSSLLQLPLYYLYVCSACYSNFKLKPKQLWHALPFVFFFVLFLVQNFSKQSFLAYNLLLEVQFLAYISFVFRRLKRFKTIYQENYSDTRQATHRWLFQITVISCLAHTVVLARLFFENSPWQVYVPFLNLVISLSVLSITSFFVLKALYQPKLFMAVDEDLETIESETQGRREKNERQGCLQDKEELSRLYAFMEKERPHLDDGLTLQKLAQQMAMPERELSILINQNTGKHFFDFINEYRINEAKTLLQEPNQKHLTVQEILFSVGFNSKSSFYSAFKKLTKETPSSFRKRMT